MIGETIGSYTLRSQLGQGGMGKVYVGVHQLLGRTAAVKVLLPEYSRDREMVQRFFNEARAATAIKHLGIVEIYDFGFAPDGTAYIVMELCEGVTLAARVAEQRTLPTATALAIARQIASALAAAHRQGIIHRDLKPDNVFLVRDAEVAGGERIKLLDFGIAKLATQAPDLKTRTGALMGTPDYMSPEQCRGAGEVDARSDLYALGCILFEMLCGVRPFRGEGVGEIIAAHIHVAPPSPRSIAPAISAPVEALVLRLLAKSPQDRVQSADALVAALQALGTEQAEPAAVPRAATAPQVAQSTAPTVVQAVTSPTTLGDAAGERPAASSRRGLWLGGIAAIAIGGGVAGAFALRKSGTAAPSDSVPVATTMADAATADATTADAQARRARPVYVIVGDMHASTSSTQWRMQTVAARAFGDAAPPLHVIGPNNVPSEDGAAVFLVEATMTDLSAHGCAGWIVVKSQADHQILFTESATQAHEAPDECTTALLTNLVEAAAPRMRDWYDTH